MLSALRYACLPIAEFGWRCIYYGGTFNSNMLIVTGIIVQAIALI
jgi:hypothetical protein